MKNHIKTWSIKNVCFLLVLVLFSSAILPGLKFSFERANAENINTAEFIRPFSNQALEAPPINQGRAINTKYPRMTTPAVEAFSHDDGTGTGYLNVSWEPIDNVTKYQVLIFNGSKHSYWTVPADQVFWTTKGKGMFPTVEQLEEGQVDYLRNGSGTEFPIDPSPFYKKAHELNGGLNYSGSQHYYIRVAAIFEDGASPLSYANVTQIPLDTPKLSNADIVMDPNNQEGYAHIEWNPVNDATGYFIHIFNGINFETLDVGNVTTFSTKNEGIWTADTENSQGQYYLLHDLIGGTFPYEPYKLYKNIEEVDQLNSYIVTVSAYNNRGETSRTTEEAALPFEINTNDIEIEYVDEAINNDEEIPIIDNDMLGDPRTFEPIDLSNVEDSVSEVYINNVEVQPRIWG
ncbi:hypothetical protein ABE28_018970 [Peribacillus muralis]|uniref:Uncharacterized protein n=1 Tax=Peribacillus muralis TaxID=264697 RepID=A0A1B3XTB3_9BACI|nr:hypothetical protein [Peribacillus muralis]AOH56455.1 hypothetical protein ABE28_018970 [Peribacillus muralis]